MESTPSELDVDDPYKLALLLRYQMVRCSVCVEINTCVLTIISLTGSCGVHKMG